MSCFNNLNEKMSVRLVEETEAPKQPANDSALRGVMRCDDACS